MAWTIEWSDSARKQLRKLDRQVARQLVDYVETRAAPDPRSLGKALTAQFVSLWRYRVGDHRIIVSIEDAVLRILVVQAGRRRSAP